MLNSGSGAEWGRGDGALVNVLQILVTHKCLPGVRRFVEVEGDVSTEKRETGGGGEMTRRATW